MVAFEVYLNRKKLCTGGIDEAGVVSGTVVWMSRRGAGDQDHMFFSFGGLHSASEEHVRWLEQEKLKVGDSIEFKVVETKEVDEPTSRRIVKRKPDKKKS